jgi:hypothetical protein
MFVLSGVSPLPEQFRFDVGKYMMSWEQDWLPTTKSYTTTGYETTTTTKGHSSTAPTSNNDSKSYKNLTNIDNICDEYTREITLIKYSNVLTGVLLVSFRLTKYRMIIVPTPKFKNS